MDALTQYITDWASSLAPNPYVQAAIVVVVAIIAARFVRLILRQVVRRLTDRTRIALDDQLIDMAERPVVVTLVLLGLSIATGLLDMPAGVATFTLAFLRTILIVVWSLFFIRLARLLLEIASQSTNNARVVQAQTLPLFKNLSTLVVVGASLYFVFLAWSIDVTAWVASAGILGIAVSFAAKDTLSNLFSGVFILADAPFKIGDFIVLDSGERGMVTHIGIRSTRLLTRDDVEITVPNSVMGNAKITNEAGGPHTRNRIRVAVSVAYGSDIDRVKTVLMDVACSCDDVCPDPEPRVRFRSFGDSGLEIELLCWIEEPVLRGRVLDDLNTAVYKRFMQDGIEIPYPKRDVYLHNVTPPAAQGEVR